MKRTKTRRRIVWLTSILLALALTVGECILYVSDYYPADLDAIAAFSADASVTRTALDGYGIAYRADRDVNAGFIFYPGGKVEHTAYEPLMVALASQGIFCVLIEMPFRLAILDKTAADGLCERYSDIEHWYIGGHSLGGVMAASYAADRGESFDGVVLLGAYATADLTGMSRGVLSIYGSEDGVLNRNAYRKNRKNLPADAREIEIPGGCHAYFGMYGAQNGDGEPTLRAEEQIRMTAAYIADFIAERRA